MHDRETVELALAALGEGMTHAEAAELVGASERSVYRWAGGRLPRSYTGRPWGSGTMDGDTTDRKAARMSAKGLYDPPATGPLAGLEPAQIENLLLRAVLADLKAGGWDPGSISSRRPGFDLEQEQVRARREIEAGDRPAPPLDHRFLEDIEELL